jgi:hypothetical protein
VIGGLFRGVGREHVRAPAPQSASLFVMYSSSLSGSAAMCNARSG